jgi:SAM-dependent methyltransferase
MTDLPESITSLSARNGFTRSAKYDQGWMFDNSMGPNPLWLIEWLTWEMAISKGSVVLDMGCGKALTSIFLAREFGCTVLANDLWISPDDNLGRIKELKLGQKVFPIQAEAHSLPYAKDGFDAITSIDAYQYFGTDDMYLDYFVKYVKPGGQIGIVIPGWAKEKEAPMPPGLEAFPAGEYSSFHTCDWWKKHIEQSGAVAIEKYEYLPDGKRIWQDSAKAMYETKKMLRTAESATPEEIKKELDFWGGDVDMLAADREDYLALIRIIMRRKG